MKIAMVAPFEESVPPAKYGGTEVVVYNLITELVRLGHDVTLFATGDSKVPCRLVPIFPQSLRSLSPYDTDLKSREAAKYLGIGKVVEVLQKEQFDIVHNHIGWRLLLFHGLIQQPILTTLHSPLSLSYAKVGLTAKSDFQCVSISNNQRNDMPDLHYVATVYNGIDLALYPFGKKSGEYLFFLSRFSPEKGAKEAIEVALKTKMKLKMACKIDKDDEGYYESLKHLIDGKQIELIGEVDMAEKAQLLGNAYALLAPIQWEEPFGLNVVEALACGTPVLGFSRGSFPELIDDGKNGFLSKTIEEMSAQVTKVSSFDRALCRKSVEERFTKETMANGYLEVYKKILERTK